MRKTKDNKLKVRILLIIGLAILIIVTVIAFIIRQRNQTQQVSFEELVRNLKGDAAWEDNRPEMAVDLLTPNEYSRPQIETEEITGIVIHYTANPGTTAADNRGYFEGLKDSGLTYASSHFVVGIEGEIIQCIPTTEIAYASNERNGDTISIEVCHPDASGKFTNNTYDSLVELTGWLCGYLGVEPENVIRHYDVTGKLCPLYYVENEKEWIGFKEDVGRWLLNHASIDE